MKQNATAVAGAEALPPKCVLIFCLTDFIIICLVLNKKNTGILWDDML